METAATVLTQSDVQKHKHDLQREPCLLVWNTLFNVHISSTPCRLEACVPLFSIPPPSSWCSALCPQTPPVGAVNDGAG